MGGFLIFFPCKPFLPGQPFHVQRSIKIENGAPSVAIGFYVQVLRLLGMAGNLSLIAKEDELGSSQAV